MEVELRRFRRERFAYLYLNIPLFTGFYPIIAGGRDFSRCPYI
ncbi:hypothetical protein MTBLM5_590005 [Magnetospirillum sp. LM-5]|nr:hypothetical protein MTBLM5_590005 [Magnetospirillum sp. LM-5]